MNKKILFEEPEKYFTNPKTQDVAKAYRQLYVKGYSFMTERHFKKMYEALMGGDPKKRSLRAIYTDIFTDYTKYSKRTAAGKEVNTNG